MKTIFSESLFLKAISVPRAVIIFDEMNRIPSNVLNIAMPLLDYRGEMYLDLAKRNIKVLDSNFITEFITEFNRAYTEIT
jgi:MoxR-like ATPase